MSKAPERFVIGAVQPKNVLHYPANAVSRIWEDELLPIKIQLIRSCGVGLFGLLIKHHFDTTAHRDFEVICKDHGLFPPLNSKMRVIISDNGFEKAPAFKNKDHLLVALNANDSEEVWKPLENYPDVLEVTSSVSKIHSHVRDIFLDIAFANTYWGKAYTKAALRNTGDKREFYRAKVAVGLKARKPKYLNSDAPYVSYSRLAKESGSRSRSSPSTSGQFGSPSHVEAFVNTWDRFFLELLSEDKQGRKPVIDMICGYPKIGGMMSRSNVKRVVEGLEKGVHILLVERRSTKMRTNPKFRNEVGAAFSRLPVIGAGGKMWGVWRGATLPPDLSLLVDKQALYAIRLLIGS